MFRYPNDSCSRTSSYSQDRREEAVPPLPKASKLVVTKFEGFFVFSLVFFLFNHSLESETVANDIGNARCLCGSPVRPPFVVGVYIDQVIDEFDSLKGGTKRFLYAQVRRVYWRKDGVFKCSGMPLFIKLEQQLAV